MRMLRKATIGLATFACVSVGVPALATHNTPQKAVQLKGEFLTAYEECTAPNAVTSNGFPACQSPVRSDPTCGFGSKGKGKFLVRYLAFGPDHLLGTSDDGDLTLQADLADLDSGCQGVTLTMALSLRSTLDDCDEQACSIIDMPNFSVATCTVDGFGKCKIRTTLNFAGGAGYCLPGKRTNIGIFEVSMMNGYSPTFRSGVLIP